MLRVAQRVAATAAALVDMAEIPFHAGRRSAARNIRPQFDQVVFRSKQVVSTLLQAIERYGYANFSRYCGTTPPGISRNAYGLLGSASVLIEMRGDIGQKSNGYIAKTAYVAAASVVEALADGSLSQADVSVAEALQLTPGDRLPAGGGGRRVARPHAEVDGLRAGDPGSGDRIVAVLKPKRLRDLSVSHPERHMERRRQRKSAGPPDGVLALSDYHVFAVLDQVLEMQCPLVDGRQDVADRSGHGLEAADGLLVHCHRRFEEDIGVERIHPRPEVPL